MALMRGAMMHSPKVPTRTAASQATLASLARSPSWTAALRAHIAASCDSPWRPSNEDMTEPEAAADPQEDDVAGTGEEEFAEGMKQNAMERDAADADQDGKLDLAEFMVMVRERDEADHTDEELAARFKALDGDGSGQIDMPEFLHLSLIHI